MAYQRTETGLLEHAGQAWSWSPDLEEHRPAGAQQAGGGPDGQVEDRRTVQPSVEGVTGLVLADVAGRKTSSSLGT